jgi:hypothetical protein
MKGNNGFGEIGPNNSRYQGPLGPEKAREDYLDGRISIETCRQVILRERREGDNGKIVNYRKYIQRMLI